MKLSNKFTLVRVLFAPIFLILYFLPIWIPMREGVAAISICIAIPLLIFAEVTDFLDGHYARKNNEVSDFGKLFDPYADVVLHLTTFMCLIRSYNPMEIPYYTPLVVLILIFIREYSQIFLRMIAVKQGIAIAARKGGKFKTVMYVVSEFFALFIEMHLRFGVILPFFNFFKYTSLAIFVVCLISSYISFADYLYHFGKVLKNQN